MNSWFQLIRFILSISVSLLFLFSNFNTPQGVNSPLGRIESGQVVIKKLLGFGSWKVLLTSAMSLYMARRVSKVFYSHFVLSICRQLLFCWGFFVLYSCIWFINGGKCLILATEKDIGRNSHWAQASFWEMATSSCWSDFSG